MDKFLFSSRACKKVCKVATHFYRLATTSTFFPPFSKVFEEGCRPACGAIFQRPVSFWIAARAAFEKISDSDDHKNQPKDPEQEKPAKHYRAQDGSSMTIPNAVGHQESGHKDQGQGAANNSCRHGQAGPAQPKSEQRQPLTVLFFNRGIHATPFPCSYRYFVSSSNINIQME